MNKSVSQIMSEFGKKGGASTKQKYGREHYVKMNKISTENKRKKKLSTAQHLTDSQQYDIL
jgi:hypothetical protein